MDKEIISQENTDKVETAKKAPAFVTKISEFLNKNEIVRLAVVLCLITSVTALLLGTVNGVTAPIIEEIQIAATNDALNALVPEAENFEEMAIVEGSDEIILNFYNAINANGEIVGYCVKVAPSGFGGAIETIVSFDANGSVTGTEIISHSETPGLGTKLITDATFAPQFVGKSGFLNIVKNSATSSQDIVAISGATVSSTAMTLGVNTAIAYVAANK